MTKVDNFFKTASWAEVAEAMPYPARPPSVVAAGWVYFSSIDLAFQIGDIPDSLENDLVQLLDDSLASGDYVKAGMAQIDLFALAGLHYPP